MGEGEDTRARCLSSFYTFLCAYLPPPSRVGGGSDQPARGHWKDVTMYVAPIGRRCGPVDRRVWATDLTSVFTPTFVRTVV